MMRRLRRRNGQRGGAAVEFALILPLFLTLVFGTMEYGWVFYQHFGMASAVRDGLRLGVTISQNATPDPKTSAVKRTQDLLAGVGISPTSVTINAKYTGASPSKTMTLSATMLYKPLIGFVPTPKNIAYAMTMMLELQ
jgi:Flp pilus assembly protein TadG